MRYLSVCSGVGSDHIAWSGLPWECVGFAEVDPFPAAVLAHHWPRIPNYGDFTVIQGEDLEGTVDLVVGGTPCQSHSIAGQRAGLEDRRGQLVFEHIRIAATSGAAWFLWENVPGVLSVNGGRDFGAILGALAECGFGCAYRVLDAQYFGVPQRRRRVFVVGYRGDWRPAAAVLFELKGLRRGVAPGQGSGEDVAGTLEASLGGSRGAGTPIGALTSNVANGGLTAGNNPGASHVVLATSPTLPSRRSAGGGMGTDFEADGGLVARALTTRNNRIDGERDNKIVAFDGAQITSKTNRSQPAPGKPCPTRASGSQPSMYGGGVGVRRLTPLECERLQGLPDHHTRIPWRGKPAAQCPDTPRYKAIGNGFAVPVVAWLGRQIQAVHELIQEKQNKQDRTGQSAVGAASKEILPP